MTSLRRNRTCCTLNPSSVSESNMNKASSSGVNENSSSKLLKKKQPKRSSFLSRFMSPRRIASANTNMTTRTSTLSLTSIDIEDGSVSMMDPQQQQQHTYPRSSGLPSEVEIVKEEEHFGDDCCLDDEDDCDEDEQEDCCQETTGSTSASKHYNRALLFAESEMYDECLEHLSAGLESLQEEDVLYWTLTELRAQVWGRMGLTRKSLTSYQGVLAHACESSDQGSSAADQASLLYTCGKLSVSLNQCEDAVDYYLRELEITVKTHAAATNSQNPLAVARIYHELARVSSKGLGESKQALGYCQEALRAEMVVRKDLSAAVVSCPMCCSGKKTKYCASHALCVQEVQQQIQDTRRSMGRIYFDQGELDQAVRFLSLM
jgi:tetratricopeptide (TPR) repeat protein